MTRIRGRRWIRGLEMIAATVVVAACGSSARDHPTLAAAHSASVTSGGQLEGLVLDPSEKAPALTLRNYTGQPVALSSLRGKAVLVTFVYTHCTNVCPLIVASLAAAQRDLGNKARDLQILAVTVDPRRDTPAAIRTFLGARDAIGRMDYLLGTDAQLRRTWKGWDVAVTVDTTHATTGHTAIVYGVSASGRVRVVFPANFSPSEVVHDVPLLARS